MSPKNWRKQFLFSREQLDHAWMFDCDAIAIYINSIGFLLSSHGLVRLHQLNLSQWLLHETAAFYTKHAYYFEMPCIFKFLHTCTKASGHRV